MSTTTHIAWTDTTWNPIVGCARVSSGCAQCYAIRDAWRMAENPKLRGVYRGMVARHANGQLDWTGAVRFLPERLNQPVRWKKPRHIFVNSMSDCFHEGVHSQWLADIWVVMSACPQHTFQILTKRPERMRAWVQSFYRETRPLSNVWLGVSVENQATAEERIPSLLRTPAAVRFLSVEPMLGPVEFSDVSRRSDAVRQLGKRALDGIHWVIVGGESGPQARPCNLAWLRACLRQCKAAGVPVFCKQLGSSWAEQHHAKDRKGSSVDEWPADLQIQEFPDAQA